MSKIPSTAPDLPKRSFFLRCSRPFLSQRLLTHRFDQKTLLIRSTGEHPALMHRDTRKRFPEIGNECGTLRANSLVHPFQLQPSNLRKLTHLMLGLSLLYGRALLPTLPCSGRFCFPFLPSGGAFPPGQLTVKNGIPLSP